MDSSAAAVRNVTSAHGSPPSHRAFARGAASSALSSAITGIIPILENSSNTLFMIPSPFFYFLIRKSRYASAVRLHCRCETRFRYAEPCFVKRYDLIISSGKGLSTGLKRIFQKRSFFRQPGTSGYFPPPISRRRLLRLRIIQTGIKSFRTGKRLVRSLFHGFTPPSPQTANYTDWHKILPPQAAPRAFPVL